MDCYNIPDLAPGEMHRAEETIHRSRFIVTMARVRSPEEAKAFIDSIRQEHLHATHNCWAYVAGEPGSTAKIGASDDGEPKGTAGRPMLTVLLHCGVGELAAVVTRYYGGILLGTGGLVRAYQGLVKLGLETLPVREKVPCASLRIEVEHRFHDLAMRILSQHNARIMGKEFASNVVMTVEVPDATKDAMCHALNEKTAGRTQIRPTDSD